MIRPCTEKDGKVWKKLNEEFMQFEFDDDNVWEDPAAKGDPLELYAEIIADKDSPNRLFMIEHQRQIIGFMNTVSFYSIWAHGKVLFLDDFFIREEFRGKGHGKEALKDLESLLKEEGYVRIQLMAEDTNPSAVNFYENEKYSKQRINFFCKYL